MSTKPPIAVRMPSVTAKTRFTGCPGRTDPTDPAPVKGAARAARTVSWSPSEVAVTTAVTSSAAATNNGTSSCRITMESASGTGAARRSCAAVAVVGCASSRAVVVYGKSSCPSRSACPTNSTVPVADTASCAALTAPAVYPSGDCGCTDHTTTPTHTTATTTAVVTVRNRAVVGNSETSSPTAALVV